MAISAAAMAEAAPSIRQQLSFVLRLFQTLTNLYFLLIEQRASTSSNPTRAAIAEQVKQLEQAIRGGLTGNDDGSTTVAHTRSRIYVAGRGLDDAGVTTNVRGEHAERIRALTVVQNIAKGKQTQSPTINDVTHAMGELNAIIVQLMRRARTHAVNQARIHALVKRIEERDADTTATIKNLAELRDRCRSLADVGEKERRAIDQARTHPLNYEDVLRYARTLSQTTTAPPGFAFDAAAAASADTEGNGRIDEGNAATAAATATASRQSRLEQVPAHLQDKLPFPSVDAIRRGASEICPPTWLMFQRGQLDGGEAEKAYGTSSTGAEDVDMKDNDVDDNNDDERQQAHQRQRRAQQAAQQQRRQKAASIAATAAAGSVPAHEEDEEEGFGLDLS